MGSEEGYGERRDGQSVLPDDQRKGFVESLDRKKGDRDTLY